MDVELIPESRALVVSHEFLWIYAIPNLKPSTEMSMTDAPAHPAIYVIPITCNSPPRTGGLSRPLITSRETRLVFFTALGFHNLVVPHDHDHPPSVSLLIPFKTKPLDVACVGLRKALIRFHDSSAIALSYPWYPGAHVEGQDTKDALSEYFRLPEPISPHLLPMLEEGTGRVVQQHMYGTVMVSDLGPYYKSNR